MGWIHQEPVFPPGIFGDQVRCVHHTGESVLSYLDGRNHVEPQEREVGQVIPGQSLSVKVGMDETQALQTRGG